MSSRLKKTAPEKTALITGASGGLGRHIASYLAGKGLNLVLIYGKNKRAARAIAESLPDGSAVEIMRGDTARYDDAKRTVRDAARRFGGVDILINNAGIHDDSPVIRMSPRQWNAVIDVNLTGAFNFARSVLPAMKARGFGRIINISSVTAFAGTPGAANYAASKAGIIGLTKSLAREVARHGITVNSISPGYFDAGMFYDMSESAREESAGRIPAGRLGRPEEVSEMVSILISCGYLTGQNFVLDGGFSA